MSQDREVRVKVNVGVENTAAKRAMEEFARAAGMTELSVRKAKEEMDRLARGQVGYGRPGVGSGVGVGAGAVGAGRAYLPGYNTVGYRPPNEITNSIPRLEPKDDRQFKFDKATGDLRVTVMELGAAMKVFDDAAGKLAAAAARIEAGAVGGGRAGVAGPPPSAAPSAPQPGVGIQDGAAGGRRGGVGLFGGRLGAVAAGVLAARESIDSSSHLRDTLYNPHAGAHDTFDAVGGMVPYVGRPAARFLREGVEMLGGLSLRWGDAKETDGYRYSSQNPLRATPLGYYLPKSWLDRVNPVRLKVDGDQYGDTARFMANEPMNRAKRERELEQEYLRRDRASELAFDAARVGNARKYPGYMDPAGPEFGPDREEPGERAAREARQLAERDVADARAARDIVGAGVNRIGIESGAAFGEAKKRQDAADAAIRDAKVNPFMQKDVGTRALAADSALVDAMQKAARYKEELTRYQEKSLALADAEYNRQKSIAGELRTQADILKSKEERLRGGYASFATMGAGEQERLAGAVRRFKQGRFEDLAAEERQLLASKPLTSEVANEAAIKSAQGNSRLKQILTDLGQKDLQTLTQERVKVEAQIKVILEPADAIKEQSKQEVARQVQEQLAKLGYKSQIGLETDLRIKAAARSAATGS